MNKKERDEMEQIQLEMKDTKGRDPGGYWNSESKQARYRELLNIQTKEFFDYANESDA